MALSNEPFKNFCSGGCSAKLGPDFLYRVLKNLPKPGFTAKNLLVGYDAADDAAVYKLSDEVAVVQTLDFFTPVVEDPYTFGKIAAANALSDIYAMGGEALMALNIVCFPERLNPDILSEILRGGAEKVHEAGAVLCGGHSIADTDIKYGLSVTGVVHPKQVKKNNTCLPGDVLILTKPLGVGIVSTAYKMGEADPEVYNRAVLSMETLNKEAAQIARGFNVHACTDVTGFGLLGHLSEMVGETFTAAVSCGTAPVISEALAYADNFLLTSAAQRNRNYLRGKVSFENVPFAYEEILFDPQTSGGLLLAVSKQDAPGLLKELERLPQKAGVVGVICERQAFPIIVTGGQADA